MSTFCQFGSPVNLIRRQAVARYDPRYNVSTVKNPPKVDGFGMF